MKLSKDQLQEMIKRIIFEQTTKSSGGATKMFLLFDLTNRVPMGVYSQLNLANKAYKSEIQRHKLIGSRLRLEIIPMFANAEPQGYGS